MKVLYVTKLLPYGMAEAHILPEMASHKNQGWEIKIAQLHRGPITHESARALLQSTFDQPLVSGTILVGAVRAFFRNPTGAIAILGEFLRSRNLAILARNLTTYPKALWLSEVIRRERFDHVHMHWAATPTTLGAAAAILAKTPYSVTAHRYDIAQRNLLRWKARNAVFIRAIDEAGANEIHDDIGADMKRPVVLHVGVRIPPETAPVREGVLDPLRVIVGARLAEKKGIRYLIEGVAKARHAGIATSVDIFGDGELEDELKALTADLDLQDAITFHGVAAHEKLLRELRTGAYDLASLTSITGLDGDKEGIPVFLMEAMAAGVPVLTTPNGGILELAGNGKGIVVPERDSDAVAEGLVRFAKDEGLRRQLAADGRAHVVDAFEVESCMRRLRGLILQGSVDVANGDLGQ